MNITCYECGQMGHIWTNCPHLTKMRTVAIKADGTEDPEMDPQEEVLPPNKEGEGEISEHQEEQLDEHMEPHYQWDTEEEEETDDNAVSYRTNAIRIVLDKEEQAMTKVIAVQKKAVVLSKTIEPMYSHRSRHREQPIQPCSDNHTLSGY